MIERGKKKALVYGICWFLGCNYPEQSCISEYGVGKHYRQSSGSWEPARARSSMSLCVPCSTRTPSHKEDLHIHRWVKRYTHTKIPLQGIPLRYWYCLKRRGDDFNCINNCETSLLFLIGRLQLLLLNLLAFFLSLPLSVSPFLSTSLFQHNALYGNSYQGKWSIL